MNEDGRGTLPSTKPTTVDPLTGTSKTFISYKADEDTFVSFEVGSDCAITVVDGDFTSTADGTAGTLADVENSGAKYFYAAEYTVAGGKLTAVKYFKKGVAVTLEQTATGYYALPGM